MTLLLFSFVLILFLNNIDNDFLVFLCCCCLNNRTDCFCNTTLLTDHFTHVAICYMKFQYSSFAFLFLSN